MSIRTIVPLCGDTVIVAVDHDPTTTATEAGEGSLILKKVDGQPFKWFVKQDAGETTNVDEISILP